MKHPVAKNSSHFEPHSQNHVEGEVYFFVTYPDVSMFYPLIDTYIYLGMNFSDEDQVDTWYFQPLIDFHEFGSALGGHERPVFCANKEQLVEFQGEEQLASTLAEVATRRQKGCKIS